MGMAWRRHLGLAFLALGFACGKSESPGSTAPNTTPSLAPMACRPGCAARPADGAAALKSGKYDVAYDAYHCADSPEAAFGAGIATLLTAIDGPSAKSVFADLGEQPIPATSIFGTTGWLGRYGARWRGTGSITRSDAAGAVLETVKLESGRQRSDSGGYYVSTKMYAPASLARLSFSLDAQTPLTAGQRLPIGCFTSGRPAPSVSYSTATLSCYSSSTDCDKAGAIVVTKPGVAAGDAVEYTLDDVLVSCTPRVGNGQPVNARLKGSFSTVVAVDKVDLGGLPELLSGDPKLKVPAGVTVEKVLASASGLAGSFELASCYFNAAGTGSGDGKVFDVPSELFGGANAVPVSRGDAKLFAGFAALAAAAVVAVEAYRLPIELRGLLCSESSGIPCISDEETVQRINAGIQALADRQKIEIARRLVASALTSFSESADGLGPQSLFVKDATTQSSVERLKAIVDKLAASLASGPTALPYFTPELKVDLRAIFDAPPDPAQISVDPLAYDPAKKQIQQVDAFWDQAFPTTATDWARSDSKYVFDNGSSLVLDAMTYRIEGSFPIGQ